MRKLLCQSAATVLISIIIGLVANFINPDGVPLFGVYSREGRLLALEKKKRELIIHPIETKTEETNKPSENKFELKSDITLNEAYEVFKRDGAIFIDARKGEEYEKGHIRGAINLYADDIEANTDLLDKIPKEMLIITYCGGEDCDLSIELANYLVEKGYFDVRIFFGGWVEWKEAGYPIEDSEQK